MASLSESLWHRNRVLAQAALEHSFVRGIASGELLRARFAYYVGQDAVFLDAFCRAYALALAKSPDYDGLIAFRELLDAAADELRDGPLQSIDVTDALLDERREVTEWANRCYRPPRARQQLHLDLTPIHIPDRRAAAIMR